MTTVADAAATYLRFGWSFIPIHHPSTGADGKRPALSEWATYFQRKPTPDEIEHWFSAGEKNIAIIAGQVSGLTILDCDDEATYRTFWFLYPALAKSLTVRTGKGYHVYAFAPEAVPTTSFELNGHRHHIKGEHSYCVAPPSQHASGRVYEWVDPDVPPIELDLPRLRSVLAKLGAKRKDETQPQNPPGWWAEAYRNGAKHGERDEVTYKMAGHLRYFGCPYEDVVEILALWAESKCDQPWGRQDVEAKVRSAFRDYPSTQRTP